MQLFLMSVVALLSSCSNSSAPLNGNALGQSSYLYVVSGSCYAGGVGTSAGPSNVIAKFDLNTGQFIQEVVDYNQLAPGDSPVSVQNFDSNHLLVLVENTSGRRIDLVSKNGSGVSTYIVNSTALSAVGRNLTLMPDYSLLVSKSSAIEKFSSGKGRVLIGANPFVSAPAGSCATATTLISSVIADPTSGKIIFTHSAGTPNNKIDVISATGYSTASDCLSATAAPTTVAMPTRAVFHPSGVLLVAYASTTLTSNFIYSYAFNSVSGALTSATKVYGDNGATVNGPSAMAVDPATGNIYVANAASTFNTVEKFTFQGGTMTRATLFPFLSSSAYTRCISDMLVAP